MKKQINSQLRFTLFAWVLPAILLLGFYAFLLRPQQQTLRTFRQQIAQKEAEKMTLRRMNQDQARQEITDELSELKEKMNRFLADYVDSSSFTFAVSELAQNENLDSFITSDSYTKVGAELAQCELITEQRIRVSYRTDFEKCLLFLNRLERNQPFLYVDEIVLKKVSPDSSDIEAELEIAVFAIKSPEKKVDNKKVAQM